ncbi:MAG: hypothetical protein IJR62_04140 [Lachnospiraceae bacterium]|nr:hypothetical protein [Lachnospiraceae bacterium]
MLAEKLDYIMKLTNTKNSDLAKALDFDPSYVSRMRSGKRGIPSHHPFVEPASFFFARRITEDYQKRSLSSTILEGREWPEDINAARIIIGAWFNDDGPSYKDTVTRFLDRISSVKSLDPTSRYPDPAPGEKAPDWAADAITAEVKLFFGKEGRRNAVLDMLTAIVADGSPVTLFMHTDENMDWLNESKFYSSRWSSLLARHLANGGRIVNIHTVNRAFGEMLASIERWMPLYLTGRVESWYCPNLRDGILRRTLFICPEKSIAVVSNTIAEETSAVMNIQVRDPDGIKALVQEFTAFQKLCRPLIRVRQLKTLSAAPSELRSFAHRFDLGDELPKNIQLYVDEEKGAAVIHTEKPYLLLQTNEPHMTRVFLDYWLLYHK